MQPPGPHLVIVADVPGALCMLFGISLLERTLRVGQRLGFREATVISNSLGEVTAHLTQPSWARAELSLRFLSRNSDVVRMNEVATGAGRVLVVSAGFYYDARLLKTMTEQHATTLLVDSAPPPGCVALWQNYGASAFPASREQRALAPLGNAEGYPSDYAFSAALLDRDWLERQDPDAGLLEQLSSDAANSQIEVCDAARQPTYLMARRKHVRPVYFPAPSPDMIKVAEQFPRDLAQNGVLDFPGLLHAPIEDWTVARLCRSSITPNQVTILTMLIGLTVTALFVAGHLWWGVVLACTIGVLDGVDGKLARIKVETTKVGAWEHVLDYCIELSWWTALAYHFRSTTLPSAFWLLLLLVGADLVDRLAKRVVKKKVGRNLDDVSSFDRFVRFIGGRRNINVWILAVALALGEAANGFVLFCGWGAATAVAHIVRAVQIRLLGQRPSGPEFV